jgi:citronellol/citronellal dehydrogenase
MIPRKSGAIINISSGAGIGPGRGPYADQTVHGGVMYGTTKAALERFTQGLAQEMSGHGGITVAAVSPSQVVPTPGTIHFKLVSGKDDPKGEPPILMARAALLLASEGAAKVNGRVTYSQQILKEFGWIDQAAGRGVTIRGSGFSEI